MSARDRVAGMLDRLLVHRRGRLAQGSGANLIALVNVTLVQLISVPVYIAAFGLADYGVWLILSTIPAYLVLSDLGLLPAAQADMAMKEAAGRTDEVLATFQSVSALVAALFGALTLLVAAGVWASEHAAFWPAELRAHLWAIPALCLYIALYMISFTSVTGLRATGHYARATVVHDGSALLESFAMMGAAWVTGSLVAAALAPAVVRAITLVPIYRDMRRLRPHLRWGLAHARMAEVRRLLPPALGSLAIPFALAINLQGSVLVIGAILGPVAVATFVPVRTASRLPVALLGAFNRALVPELSRAHGSSDVVRQRRYWRMSALLSLAVLAPAVLLLTLLGPPLVSLWTGGAVATSHLFIGLMSLAAAVHGAWFYRFLLLSASNAHAAAALHVVLVTTAGLVLGALAALRFDLPGVAGALLLVEFVIALLLERLLARRAVYPYGSRAA